MGTKARRWAEDYCNSPLGLTERKAQAPCQHEIDLKWKDGQDLTSDQNYRTNNRESKDLEILVSWMLVGLFTNFFTLKRHM